MDKIVSIVGLSASGKSALGIKIAQEFGGEIISADSRQVYRGLDIGTAKVTKQEQSIAPHHLLDVVDAGEQFDVFEFQKQAYATIENILTRKKLPVIVGGTGLYSRSVVEGYSFDKTKNKPRYSVLQICLLPPKDYIRPLVESRIESRLKEGMLDETSGLLARGVSRDWLRSLGLEYYWNIEYIEGHVTLDEYKKNLATKTMQFVKRQRTWFRREKNTHFLTDPNSFYTDTKKLVAEFLKG